ncbi:hypothetical protein [Ensifer sp. ZNC0028]|uniref:hypothetical protein n=1 Tax=Ensifer sp. ZNC0028 TaxID=1339236 RepID=UPI0012E02A8D|nr:hypothetical protein [Ensifer sp. ZNC0028]
MSRFALAFVLTVSMSQPVAASTDEFEKAVFAALHLSEFQRMPAEQRKQLAQASLAYWKSFDSRIPRNSPAETEWLLRELDTTDTTRIGRAINSPAYAQKQLAELSTNCIGIFEKLLIAIGGTKDIELYLWLKSTQCYSNTGVAHYQLLAGLSNGRYDGAFKMQSFTMVLSTITGKLANTIVQE